MSLPPESDRDHGFSRGWLAIGCSGVTLFEALQADHDCGLVMTSSQNGTMSGPVCWDDDCQLLPAPTCVRTQPWATASALSQVFTQILSFSLVPHVCELHIWRSHFVPLSSGSLWCHQFNPTELRASLLLQGAAFLSALRPLLPELRGQVLSDF